MFPLISSGNPDLVLVGARDNDVDDSAVVCAVVFVGVGNHALPEGAGGGEDGSVYGAYGGRGGVNSEIERFKYRNLYLP
jgi:hypothetical protein